MFRLLYHLLRYRKHIPSTVTRSLLSKADACSLPNRVISGLLEYYWIIHSSDNDCS